MKFNSCTCIHFFSDCTSSGTFRTNRGQEITMTPFHIRDDLYVFGAYEDNIFKMAAVSQTGDFVENRYHESDIMTEDMSDEQREEIWDTSRATSDNLYSVYNVLICGTKHLHLNVDTYRSRLYCIRPYVS